MKMQFFAFAAILTGLNFFALAQDHSHHGDGPAQKIQLDHGKKWSTDKPLQQGMEKINELAKANLPAVHSGKLSEAQYSQLGQEMKQQTDFILKNCKLPPAADQELHKILLPLLSAEASFSSKSKPEEKHEAFLTVLKSLELYGTYFDHKNWNSPK